MEEVQVAGPSKSLDDTGEIPTEMIRPPTNTPKTILRLKRRLEDTPTKILVMSFKRRKEMEDEEVTGFTAQPPDEEVNAVFCLAGTSTTDEVNHSVAQSILAAFDNVKKTSKGTPTNSASAREHFKTRNKKILQKSQEENKLNSKDNRFKVVSSKRGITASSDAENEEGSSEAPLLFNLLDLVDDDEIPSKVAKKERSLCRDREIGSVTVNGIPMIKDRQPGTVLNQNEKNPDEGFVFDIYVAREGMGENPADNEFVSVHLTDDDLMFERYREDDSGSEYGGMDDDDSNDEGNWRNDYPDTDPDSDDVDRQVYVAEDDDDVAEGFSTFHIGGCRDELSSDDEGEYIYSTENDGADEGLGGVSGARYRAKVLRAMMSDEVVSSPDSDSD